MNLIKVLTMRRNLQKESGGFSFIRRERGMGGALGPAVNGL